METKLIEIGNSKGLRIPKKLIQKYHLTNTLDLEEKEDGILIKPIKDQASKFSWEETYKEMQKETEDWKDFDTVLIDGLD